MNPTHRSLALLFLTILVHTLSYGIVAPVLPQLIMDVAHVELPSATRIGGLLFLVYACMQFLCGPAVGALADRFGRRPVLLLAVLTSGANSTLMALAPDLTLLFIGRAMLGMSGAIYGVAAAFVADVLPAERRAHGFGVLSSAIALGFVLGPALGGLLGELGPRAPFVAAACLAAPNLVIGYFVLPESLPHSRRTHFSLAQANPLRALRMLQQNPRVRGLALVTLLWLTAAHVYPSAWSYFVMVKFHLSSYEVGLTLALSGLSLALVQGFVTGRLVAFLGEETVAPVGIATGVLAFVAYAFLPEPWMLYPVLALGGLQGSAMPALNALMSREAGAARQGELQGALGSVMGLGAVVGPVVLTQTLALFSADDAPVHFPGAVFLLAALLALAALIILVSRIRASASAQTTRPAEFQH